MAKRTSDSRLVRLLPKGQITLPAEYRRRLQLDDDTLLRLTLTDEGLQVIPVRTTPKGSGLREYSDREIARFLAEDRLDAATAAKVRRLLNRKDAA
jgi:bifunctional DNA-binding transcriptional regulator/antitoxin component of YhaV-PrlF toxin-antitoxin module